jgi:Fe2+ transport system protein FeoA
MALNLHTLSLSEIRAGESVVVCNFSRGLGIAGRLTSLGFTPGVEVQMTQNFGHGPLIVTVRGTRVALGRGEAAKICVEKKLA